MIMVREGNKQDFRVYVGGHDYPKEWCVEDPKGLAIFDDDKLIAIAMVTIDELERTWIWFHQRTSLPAIVLHRRAIELLNALRASGRIVHAFVDQKEPGAEEWFRRLGFQPAGLTTHPTGEERPVWQRK